MNHRPLTPALFVAYDDPAPLRRIRHLQPDDSRIATVTRDDLDVAALKSLFVDVGATDPFLVVHLVGPRDETGDDAQTLVDAVESVRTKVLESHPGLQALRIWVVHAVDRRIDEAEVGLIRTLLQQTDLRGVLVTTTSTKASVAHSAADLHAFSADASTLLRIPDFEAELAATPPSAWACGVASVSYSTARLGQAVSAFHSARLIAECLLPEPEAADPAYDLGEDHIREMDLGGDAERRRLLRAPRGGTLLARLRMDDIAFDHVPVTAWCDTITTRHDLLALRELPFVENRIRENAEQRLGELREDTTRAMLDWLEQSRSLESTMRFCEGMRRRIEEVLGELRGRKTSNLRDQTVADRDRLRRLLRLLPFGPAVAVRLLAFSVFVWVLAARLVASRVGSDASFTTIPLGAAATVLVVGSSLYFRRLRSTVRVRDRLAAGLEKLLEADVEDQVLSARIDLLTRLRDWVGRRPPWWAGDELPAPAPAGADSLAEWLGWLRHDTAAVQAVLEVRSSSREVPGLGSTRYAVDLPAPDDTDISTLADQLLPDAPSPQEGAEAMIRALRGDVTGDTLPVFGADELAERWSSWLEAPVRDCAWPGLTDLVADDPQAAHRARRVLETDVTPALDGAEPQVRHYLVVPGGEQGRFYTTFLEDDHEVRRTVSAGLTGVYVMPLDSFAAMVHLYRLEIGDEEGGG